MMRLIKEIRKRLLLPLLLSISVLVLIVLPAGAKETSAPQALVLSAVKSEDAEGNEHITEISVTYQNTSSSFLSSEEACRIRVRYRLNGGPWFYADSAEAFKLPSDFDKTETVSVFSLGNLQKPEDCPGYEALKEGLETYTTQTGETGVCFGESVGTLEVGLRYEKEHNEDESGEWSESAFWGVSEFPEDCVVAYAARVKEEESGDAVEICFAVSEQVIRKENTKIYVQMDCSVDGEEYRWNAEEDLDNAVWQSPFLNEEIQAETFQQLTALRFSEEKIAALFAKNVLKTGQHAGFQWDAHTLFTRIRLVAETGGEGDELHYAVSEWSDVFALGKEQTEWAKPEKITAPVILGTALSVDGEAKMLSVYLSVNDDAMQTCVYMRLHDAGTLYAHMEISINGGDWQSLSAYLLPAPDEPLIINMAEIPVPAYALIRVRAALGAADVAAFPIEAEWSEAAAVNALPEAVTDLTSALYGGQTSESAVVSEETGEGGMGQCSVCHICGRPFGICLFVLGGSICAVLLVVVCLTAALKAGKKKCPRCGKGWNRRVRVCGKCGFRFAGAMPHITERTDKTKNENSTVNRQKKELSSKRKPIDEKKKKAVRDIRRARDTSDKKR